VSRLRATAFIAALYTTAYLVTACHHVPAVYEAPISTWENQ